MYFIAGLIIVGLYAIISFIRELLSERELIVPLASSIIVLIFTVSLLGVDYHIQTQDTEIWSGTIIDVEHQEEYSEWVPEVCSTNSSTGVKSCTGGYWKHHDATDKIKTSDEGWISVDRSLDGSVKFTNKYPNNDQELLEYYPLGTPTASVHSYVNKLKASYSIFKHSEVNENNHSLPDYPSRIYSYVKIDRILGDVPNREAANDYLSAVNSELNTFIDDPERPGKKRSWKQVNIIFVNLGEDAPLESGLALQNKWRNGAKNDLIVSFSLDSSNKFNWVHVFSWTEVEILKLEIRDKLMKYGQVNDFIDIIDIVKDKTIDKFERKEFADFNYIQIKPTWIGIVIPSILAILIFIVTFPSIRQRFQ